MTDPGLIEMALELVLSNDWDPAGTAIIIARDNGLDSEEVHADILAAIEDEREPA